ncbi:MAG TPA: tetratricopeptide repeat protein [Hyphomicrobiaceae bacterium]|jgi:DNA-binding winged helix-turn-helix (wHTH) protein/TolB-like protein/tetratricopeptide (TPR) repeat protein
MDAVYERVYEFEGFILDMTRRTLCAAERGVELRPKSFDVLCCLVEHAGRLVTKDALFQAVWPGVSVTDESIARCVSDIRRALGDRGQQIVKTIPGRGYLLAAAVTRAPASSQNVLPPSTEWVGEESRLPEPCDRSDGPAPSPAAGDRAEARVESAPAKGDRASSHGEGARATTFASFALQAFDRRRLGSSLLAASALLGLFWLALHNAPTLVDANARNGILQASQITSGGIPIAVLPFTATSGSAASLAERMNADLTNYLSRIHALRVVSSQGVAQHSPGRQPDVRASGASTGTRYVLVGAVYAEGDQLRVNIAVIDARSGQHLWSHHFSQDSSKWPLAQEDIVRRTVFAVHFELMRRVGAEALNPGKEPSVGDLVARGRAGILDTEDSPLFNGAKASFSEALRRDPESTGAMIGLAAYYLLAERDQHVNEAEDLLRRALARNTQNDAVHYWFGLLHRIEGNLSAALESYDRALEINPSHAPAYAGKGRALINLHRYEEALQLIRYAQRLNADTSIVTVWQLWAGWAELELGHLDAARAAFNEAIAARPHGPYVHASLAALHALTGEWQEAHRHVAELRKLTPGLTDQQRLVEFSLARHGHQPQERLLAGLTLALEADGP